MERVLVAFIPALIGNCVFIFYLSEIGKEEPLKYFSACEFTFDGAFRQPVNSWTSLGHVAVGLLTAVLSAYLFDPLEKKNLMTSVWYLPAVGSSLLVLVGGMSLFYHGLATERGARMDGLAILWYLSFLEVLGYLRIGDFFNSRQSLHCRFWVNFVLMCWLDYLFMTMGTHDQKDMYRNIKIGLAILLETIYGTLTHSRGAPWWFFGLAVLALAVMFWKSETCWDHSHGMWHLLSSIALGLIEVHYLVDKSETCIPNLPL
jgi:hypothetical protein